MSDSSMEKRLKLAEQIRSQYHKNEAALQQREQLLTDHSSADLAAPSCEPGKQDKPRRGLVRRIRLLAAVTLFLFLVVMDKRDILLFGIDASRIFQYIAADCGDYGR